MPLVARVLVVEDDAAIVVPLTRALTREGYEVVTADSIDGATAVLAQGGVDLVVLDRGLPDGDGLEVVRRAREAASALPFLVLTARAEEADLVTGLDAGADDYLTKPFRLPELLARLRALMRRVAPEVDDDPLGERSVLTARGVRLDQGSHQVWKDGVEVHLSVKEYDLLRVLLREAGAVVSRDRLMSRVWGSDWFGSTKTLDMHVSWLRRKLGDPVHRDDQPRLITTVRGVGFRFERDDD